MRVVPIRGFSGDASTPFRRVALEQSRLSRGGRGALRDAGRPKLPDELFVLALSGSGGGVGGNKMRLRGGSDCCRLLVELFWTGFVGGYESVNPRWGAVGVLLLSEPEEEKVAMIFAFPR